MENEAIKPEVKEKKAGGKKKGNKPTGNPAGRKRAQSTVLQNFQKNTLANNASAQDSKKPIVEGMDQNKFKGLLGMFDKKPEDANVEKEKPSFGKMNNDRMSMFNKQNTTVGTDLNPIGTDAKPRLSIKDRMAALMQSKEDSKFVKKNDPIMERLNEGNEEDEEDEDSYDDDLSEGLSVSEGDKDNDDLKSESLSGEAKSEKNDEIKKGNDDDESEESLVADAEVVEEEAKEKTVDAEKKDDEKVEEKDIIVAEVKAEVVAEVKAEVVAEVKAEVVTEVKAEVDDIKKDEKDEKKKEDLNKSEDLDDWFIYLKF